MAERPERQDRWLPASGDAIDSGSAVAEPAFPRAVRAAIAYLRLNPHRAVPMAELAIEAGVSPRRLQEHFRRFVGMPPKSYGLRLRLNAVRRELRQPSNDQPVTRVALHYGFPHLGRFSQQYRRLFGELPSVTRSRPALEAGGRSPLPAPRPRGDRPEILVQPFVAPPALAELAEFLAQRIANMLAGETRIARARRRSVPGRRRDITARYLIEGRFVVAGDRFQIVLTLLDAETDAQLWGDAWSGSASQPFPVIQRAIGATAGAVLPNIRKAEIARVMAMRPQDMASYELCLRVYPLLAANTAEHARHALDLLYPAIERDPDYGLATALAAWGHAQLLPQMSSAAPVADREQALRLSARSLVLDPDDATVLTACSQVYTVAGEFDHASDLVTRALVRNPSLAWAWERSGWLRASVGDMTGATACFGRALRLDPSGPAKAMPLLGFSLGFFDSGRYDLAIRWMHRALQIEPGAAWINRSLAVAYARVGNHSAARQAAEALRRYRPDITVRDVASAMHFSDELVSRVANGLSDLGLPP